MRIFSGHDKITVQYMIEPNQTIYKEGGRAVMETKNKKLPVGIEMFRDIREHDFYYIDKTGFIKELLESWTEVNLFTRPRRLGKSLNMDMLKAFLRLGRIKDYLMVWRFLLKSRSVRSTWGNFR